MVSCKLKHLEHFESLIVSFHRWELQMPKHRPFEEILDLKSISLTYERIPII